MKRSGNRNFRFAFRKMPWKHFSGPLKCNQFARSQGASFWVPGVAISPVGQTCAAVSCCNCSGVMATGNAIELALQAQVCAALNRHVATDDSQ
jgi:hypothetical protein